MFLKTYVTLCGFIWSTVFKYSVIIIIIHIICYYQQMQFFKLGCRYFRFENCTIVWVKEKKKYFWF